MFLLSFIGIQLGALGLARTADFNIGILMVHLLALDPRWVPPQQLKVGELPPVVFFDGVCGLCDRLVTFLLEKDRHRVLRFATLQGELATRMLGHRDEKQAPKSVVYWNGSRHFDRSDAVLHIFFDLGGFWKLFAVFLLVPRTIRNAVYDFIAARRYRWFGKMDACRMPRPEERDLFLD